ncbi:MAG: phenylalanine--tRNA ligase subunit beta [Phycisphaeraceae bacterium]|nr:phenylalanine--tRNA ligase subunit beta [Phycisphaeraceae bacterium]
MRTSVAWINDYLEPNADADEQASVLTRVGLAFDGREPLDDGDTAQEIETTSNRGDCLCHLGLAREIAAATGRRLKTPGATISGGPRRASDSVRVTVEDTVGCPRYTARIIRGVRVAPSPEWMQRRLRAIGQIPRNNLVDCTNFVLFEMGQPTHVFDLAALRGGEIRVRRAKAGERFLPLGEGAHALTLVPEDLVIADGERPVALAGVKGGAETAVTAQTVDVLLEAATFDGPLVRAMSRRHRVTSDSAYRFQRGVHPMDIDAAAARLAALILETAGGTLELGVVEAGAPAPATRTVSIRPARARSLLGIDLGTGRMLELLEALELAPVERGDRIECTIPPRRIDIEREVDLIEELARTHGLDALPVQERIEVRPSATQPFIMAKRAVRAMLVGAGAVETVTHTLISERLAAAFLPPQHAPLRVDDERAGGEPILRPSVIPSLLQVRKRNADAGVSPLDLFEFGSAFHLEGTEHREREVLGMVLDAGEPGRPLTESTATAGFRRLRGVVERLATRLLGSGVRVEVRAEHADAISPAPALAPAAAILWNGERVGVAGIVTAAVQQACGLDVAVVAAELEIRRFMDNYPAEVIAQPMPAFPAIERDLSILVDEGTPWEALARTVIEAKAPRFESLAFVGTYRGAQTAGRKSVTMRLHFRDPARTMKREEADGAVATIVAALSRDHRAELRA